MAYYIVVDKRTNKPVPHYPDDNTQGGVDQLNGNKPVFSLFKSRRVAKSWCAWLRDDPFKTKKEPYEVREVSICIKTTNGR